VVYAFAKGRDIICFGSNDHISYFRGGDVMNEVKEALKEAGRVVALAVIPLLIDGVTRGVFDWRLYAITGAVAFLRFVDKWLHETGHAEKGITRF